MSISKLATILFVVAFIIGLQLLCSDKYDSSAKGSFHSAEELDFFQNSTVADIDTGAYFLHSVECKGCHGFDTLGIASIDSNGVDINLYDDWEATMMANSAIDPLWRAKVSHEILVNPGHAADIENTCTSCHAPMGHFTAMYSGINQYSMAMLDTDSLGKNGVSCTGCHEIGTNNLGSVFSGNIPYDTSKVEYGPFQNPVAGPMQLYVGRTPVYSAHMSEGRVCSPCHTLQAPTLDLSGNPTGETFIEQATYHEWVNSVFPADNISCQQCHMPQTTDSIIIANNIANLPPRAPFNKHKFTGANSFMVELIKNNKTALGLATADVRFDSTISAINRFLRQNTLSVDLSLENLSTDTAFISLRLTNKAGHKFPSGYPSRRAVVQLFALDQSNDTVFRSGLFDPNYEVVDIDTFFEPHYNIINSEDQVQIYEMVMGDVNNNKTTVLLRADTVLKDNRMVPEGFLTTSSVYDTVKIGTEALIDPDFNKDISGNEGTGRDFIHYHIPLYSFSGTIRIYTNIFYQSVPPGWVSEMFTYNSAPIDSFKNMYMNADRTPVLVGTDSLIIFSVNVNEAASNDDFIVTPNPVNEGKIYIKSRGNQKIQRIDVYSTEGKLVNTTILNGNSSTTEFQMPENSGIYVVQITTRRSKVVKKIVVE